LNPMRTLMLILVASALAACGGGGGGNSDSGSGKTAAPATSGSGDETARFAEAAKTNPIVARSLARDPGPPNEYALIQTNYGDIKIRFFPKQAPLAVANFKGLAAAGYYDGVTFHRVVKDFIIQGGDPIGNGTGGTSLWGKPFRDEFDPALTFGRPGMVAMANPAKKNYNQSQFFINVDQADFLDNKHTIFGEVMEGMATLDAISSMPVNSDSKPLETVTMEKVTILTE